MNKVEEVVKEIKKNAKQVAINKIDEVKVMKAMLNDSDFKVGVYNKRSGELEYHCPKDSINNMISSIIHNTTGLDNETCKEFANKYEYTSKDAQTIVDISKDFINTYTDTGRKINIVQDMKTEAYLYKKQIAESTKTVPDRLHGGEPRTIHTESYTKLVSSSKCPKYIKK